MIGANNNNVDGQTTTNKVLNSLTGQNISNNVINSVANSNPITSLIKDTIEKKGDK